MKKVDLRDISEQTWISPLGKQRGTCKKLAVASYPVGVIVSRTVDGLPCNPPGLQGKPPIPRG